MTVRYGDFGIEPGQRLVLTLPEPGGRVSTLFWSVPFNHDQQEPDLTEEGLYIADNEGVHPETIALATGQEQLPAPERLTLIDFADVRVGDTLLIVLPLSYELLYTVQASALDEDDPNVLCTEMLWLYMDQHVIYRIAD